MVGSKCGFLQMQGTGRRGLPWNRTSCAVASPQKPAMPFTGARPRTQSSCLGVTRSWFPYPPQPSHDPPSPISIEPTVQGTLAPKPPYRVRVPAVVDAFRVARPRALEHPHATGVAIRPPSPVALQASPPTAASTSPSPPQGAGAAHNWTIRARMACLSGVTVGRGNPNRSARCEAVQATANYHNRWRPCPVNMRARFASRLFRTMPGNDRHPYSLP